MRKGFRRFLIAIAVMAAAVGLLSFFILSRPKVCIIDDNLPPVYRRKLYNLCPVGLSYRLSRDEKADLVICSELSEKKNEKALVWGTIPERDIYADESALWSYAIEKNAKVNMALVYERNTEQAKLAESLLSSNPFIVDLGYDNRITEANIRAVLEKAEKGSATALLVLTPDSCYPLLKLNEGYSYYLDWRDGAAISGIKGYAIEPDWAKAIKSLISGDEKVSLAYRLRSL